MVFGLVATSNGPLKLRRMKFGTELGYTNIHLAYEILLRQKV
jgi:hypothetical protein